MQIIDAHHHLWDLAVRDQEWISGPELQPLRRSFTLPDFEAQAREAGVAAGVLVQTVGVPEETPEFLSLAVGSDLIGAVVGWTDLTSPGVADELARLRGLPGGAFLRGIGHQVQGRPIRSGSPAPMCCGDCAPWRPPASSTTWWFSPTNSPPRSRRPPRCRN